MIDDIGTNKRDIKVKEKWESFQLACSYAHNASKVLGKS